MPKSENIQLMDDTSVALNLAGWKARILPDKETKKPCLPDVEFPANRARTKGRDRSDGGHDDRQLFLVKL